MRQIKVIGLIGAMLLAGIAPECVYGASAAGAKSSAASRSKHKKPQRSRHMHGQATPTPERISEIQRALIREGALTGAPSGKWNDSTVSAMQRFQSAHGLKATGKIDALTLQKLGFGSETSGIAPPQPMTPSTSGANQSSTRRR